jgi:NADH:ubiquinone oxidoreductase subunit H
MRLGWKIFLPTSLAAVAAIGYYVTFLAPAAANSVAGG